MCYALQHVFTIDIYIYISTYLPIYLPTHLTNLSIYLSVYLSIYHLSIYLPLVVYVFMHHIVISQNLDLSPWMYLSLILSNQSIYLSTYLYVSNSDPFTSMNPQIFPYPTVSNVLLPKKHKFKGYRHGSTKLLYTWACSSTDIYIYTHMYVYMYIYIEI